MDLDQNDTQQIPLEMVGARSGLGPKKEKENCTLKSEFYMFWIQSWAFEEISRSFGIIIAPGNS